ncbi:helix-turn-helix domain-containing protein [Marinobacter sp.]|uniref:helix-turn-helix domain-containing protein n=1 Tax=Marinobacter sp. TaxID=50741 RepID=UPI003A94A976
MRNTVPDLELDAYLRVNRASLVEWLAAIREISGCDELECRLHQSGGPVGALSALGSDGGNVVCVYASQGMDITGNRSTDPVLLLSRAGNPEISLQNGAWKPLPRLLLARPSGRFRLRLSENSQVMILRPAAGMLGKLASDDRPGNLAACENLITCYLHRSFFFRNDAHARDMTHQLFGQLAKVVGNEGRSLCQCPELDRRLLRAIEKIRQEPDWDFDLQALASHSGVSERNLYYLMKRETGMTPYRLYQRNRLMRVRHQLVDCQCDVPHISRYAADAGFSHLGRFAALYRDHFGELPSETVQWRRKLQHREPALVEDLFLT